jgi:hypothetical protein
LWHKILFEYGTAAKRRVEIIREICENPQIGGLVMDTIVFEDPNTPLPRNDYKFFNLGDNLINVSMKSEDVINLWISQVGE